MDVGHSTRSAPEARIQKRWNSMMAFSEVFACTRAFDETLGAIELAGAKYRETGTVQLISHSAAASDKIIRH